MASAPLPPTSPRTHEDRKCEARIIISVAGTAAILATGLGAWFILSGQPVLRVAEIVAGYDEGRQYRTATIRYPFPEAIFSPDIAAPTFRWEDSYDLDCDGQADAWVVRIEFQDGKEPLAFESRSPEWTPAEEDWSHIKQRSLGAAANVTLIGIRRSRQDVILAAARTVFHVSPDKVAAPLFYREVNLPFIEAVKDPSKIRWRFGALPRRNRRRSCWKNCRSAAIAIPSPGMAGRWAMDVDYANNKGSYVIMPVGASRWSWPRARS